jgi:alkylation response protein AidB-like acyl-CoA dehydrogenase
VQRDVIPVATEMEHRNEYPHALVETMKKLGLFGLNIPDEFGGSEIDYTTFAMVFEELSRGWMGLAGIIGSHSVLCDVLVRFGTNDQKLRFLPRLAQGEPRGGICLSEPNAGTDLQAISTTARRDGDIYYVTGSKMWVTNGRHAQIFLLLVKTDPDARPAHRGMSAFVIEKGEGGLTVGRDIDKMGYKTVETVDLHFDNFPVPAANLIGGVEGLGFKHVMTGLEAERLNVAARGLGVARAAFEEAIEYAQQRHTFGKPIAEHQTIQIKLGNQDRSFAPVDLLGIGKEGPEGALRSRGRHGETVCYRNRSGSVSGSHAHHGRQWLLKGLPCGTVLPGCAFARDWRRYQ